MSLPREDAAALSARWTEGVLLKRDVFSTVERGRFRTDAGEVDAVLRRLDQVPWWSFIPARHLFARERRALALANDLRVGPQLLWAGRQALVRGFIDGVALHLAKPFGDAAYFRSAKQALRKLHRAGICHNDLAKEQNWLRGSDGRAYLTDFQLAVCFKTRTRLFRIAAYEDLRHLLKHKRSYAPEALTPIERKILARKSLVASVWLKTGKKVYRAITRGLFNFTDREGGGPERFRQMERNAADEAAHQRLPARPQQLRADTEVICERQRATLAREEVARRDEGPPRHLVEPTQHRIDFTGIGAKATALDGGKHVALQ